MFAEETRSVLFFTSHIFWIAPGSSPRPIQFQQGKITSESSTMQANKMDRGSEALKSHMNGCSKMQIRQTRRGWLQECFGCEARTEFRYFINETQVFHSLEDASCCCRFLCPGMHPFQMVVKELNTDAEIITVDRPFRCGVGGCKCCCYQEATISSGGNELGMMKEDCWYWCV